MSELLPCPFCGAGTTQFREQKHWTGMASVVLSVSVYHWCEPVEGQPSRVIERIGKDKESATAAWNRRVLSTGDAEPASRIEWAKAPCEYCGKPNGEGNHFHGNSFSQNTQVGIQIIAAPPADEVGPFYSADELIASLKAPAAKDEK